MNELTKQQERFVTEYIRILDAREAAIRAGYSKSKAKQQGMSLLQRDYILNAIRKKIITEADSLQISKGYVVQRLLNIIEFSIEREDLLDKEGLPTGKMKIRDTQASLRALDFLCKHLGMSGDGQSQEAETPSLTIIENLSEKKI